MLVPALFAALASFGFQVDNAEFTNVVFHVSCLGGQLPCTKPSFEKFWHEDLHWTAADQQQVDSWVAALAAVADRMPGPPESPFVPNYPVPHTKGTAVLQIIAAAFDSRSADEFRKRARELAMPAEIDRLSRALEHFQRRLRPWWKSQGEHYGNAHLRAFQARLNAPSVTASAERIRRFTESPVTGGKFHVHLIPRADPQTDACIATPVGNHLLMELTDKAEPRFVALTTIHELTHSLYASVPEPLQQQLMRDFAAAPQPQSQALYALLNEGIATAMQFLDVSDPSPKDEDSYRHPFVPRIGRAISPALASALEKGPTLYHGFLDAYLRAGAAELKEEIASPRFILSSTVLLVVGDLAQAEQAFRTQFTPVNWADFSNRDRFPEVNIVILITYDKLDAIEGNWNEIVPLSKTHRGYAFTMPRNRKGRTYVLAARDEQTLTEVVKRLAAIRTATPDGLIFAIE
jgi:hypothetical protein